MSDKGLVTRIQKEHLQRNINNCNSLENENVSDDVSDNNRMLIVASFVYYQSSLLEWMLFIRATEHPEYRLAH